MSHKGVWKNSKITGRWKSIGVNGKERIGMWKSKDFDQALLFEFRKKGEINVYIDTDDDWNLNRKEDTLIGKDKMNKLDKKNFSKDLFYSKNKGNLSFYANYGGHDNTNNAESYEYYINFHKKNSYQFGPDNPFRDVMLKADNFGLNHLWFHNGDELAAYGGESIH